MKNYRIIDPRGISDSPYSPSFSFFIFHFSLSVNLRSKFPDHPRVEFMLGDLDACVERLRCVAREEWNAALAEDRAGIDPGIDKVNGAACLGHSRLERLTPCFQSPEGREERGMDVQDPPRKGPKQRFLDDAHEPGEHDEIDPRLAEHPDNLLLGFRGHLRTERTRCHKMTGDPELLRKRKDACGLDVRENDHRFAPEGAAAPCLGQRTEVGSLSGTKDAESAPPIAG